MKVLLEHVRNIVNEMDIPISIDEAVRENNPPVSGYDVWTLEDMLLKVFEDIASEVIYNIDLWRQEIQYGKGNIPKLKELIQDKIKYKPLAVKYPGKPRKVIVRQVDDK